MAMSRYLAELMFPDAAVKMTVLLLKLFSRNKFYRLEIAEKRHYGKNFIT